MSTITTRLMLKVSHQNHPQSNLEAASRLGSSLVLDLRAVLETDPVVKAKMGLAVEEVGLSLSLSESTISHLEGGIPWWQR